MDNHTHFHRITKSSHSFITNVFFLFSLLLALSSNSYAAQSLIYDANGGTGTVPPTVTYNNGNTVTVYDDNGLTKTGYEFGGWNTTANGSGITYQPGDTFTFGTTEITLYAKWDSNTSTTPPTPVTCANGATPIYIDETNPTIIGEGPLDDRCYAFQYTNHDVGGSVQIYYWSDSAIDINQTIDTFSESFALSANTDTTKGPYTMDAGDSLVLEVESINNNKEYSIIIDYVPNIETVNDSYIVEVGDTLHANVLSNDNNSTNIYIDTTNSNLPGIQADGSFTYNAISVGEHLYYYTATNGTDSLEENVLITVLSDNAWPSTCYGYYYRQGDNTNLPTTNPPSISGNFATDENISVTVYIKNVADDYNTTIPSMSLNIQDPSSDLSYSGPSTIYKSTPTEVNQYFFAQFLLTPQTTDTIDEALDMNLTISGTTGRLGHEIAQCGGGLDTIYAPFWGRFNVLSNLATFQNYYNLPTQTTKRFEEFNIASYALGSDFTQASEVATMVGVEIIDTSEVDINIACQDETEGRSLTDRIWIRFGGGNNYDTNISSLLVNYDLLEEAINENPNKEKTLTPEDFYKVASKNAAYRISYYGAADDELLQYTEAGNKYVINNFPEVVQDIGTCVDEVLSPVGNSDNLQPTIRVAVACGNAGNTGISYKHLQACLECLHGKSYVCSRDNFAIRPEAFMMHLKDQNQSNPALQTDITTLSHSGSIDASAPELSLAAGYNYNLEINATNHIDNESSPGYTTYPAPAVFEWNPASTVFCNDTSDHTTPVYFSNGAADLNASINQVGRYTFGFNDTTWTSVDSNESFQAHHTGDHFKANPDFDCTLNSSIVQVQGSPSLNGCTISSHHINLQTDVVYNDYNMTTHPYKFTVTNNILSVGLTDTQGKNFVYMANIENNESVSVHLDTNISAQGYNDSNLSNYTGEINASGFACYAQDTLFGIGKSATTSTLLPFRYRIHDLNATGAIIVAFDNTYPDINNSVIAEGNLTGTPIETIPAEYWRKAQNGQLSLRTNLNFDRNISRAVNPEDINYTRFDMNNTLNLFSADLINNKYTDINKDTNEIGQVIHHYYGRSHAAKQRYIVPDDSPYTANLFYEIYCYDIGCNLSSLPSSSHTDDIRWYRNTLHNTSNEGNITNVSEKDYTHVTTSNLNTTTNPSKVDLSYDAYFGYPYQTTMDMNTSNWLIYNPDDENATVNEFQAEFNKAGDWSGEHETNSTTNVEAGKKANRRINW
ncbi:InlB B-repeat-containing protein [Sulfurimonas marina]|uniref:InlB B-repeat-containing protein n=1 Tax=Sulfurimonas marina TaxID=2590551 RepID=A0A7M1AZF9_9BACT|nr:InlB B-repeat-containing protein [Sulfurimonas marina]QOP41938.1 InlB B-repeat-containing protein [Sulfurimonas marina]